MQNYRINAIQMLNSKMPVKTTMLGKIKAIILKCILVLHNKYYRKQISVFEDRKLSVIFKND